MAANRKLLILPGDGIGLGEALGNGQRSTSFGKAGVCRKLVRL